MGAYVAGQLVKAMLKRRIHVDGARVLVLGLTFKENCSDLRNTCVVDVVRELQDYGIQVDVHDPWADADEAHKKYGLNLVQTLQDADYDGIVLTVAHDRFKAMRVSAMRRFGKVDHVLYDLKNILSVQESDLRL